MIDVGLLEKAIVGLCAHNMFFVLVMMVICFHRPKWIPMNRIYRVRELLVIYVMFTSFLLVVVSFMFMYANGFHV